MKVSDARDYRLLQWRRLVGSMWSKRERRRFDRTFDRVMLFGWPSSDTEKQSRLERRWTRKLNSRLQRERMERHKAAIS